MSGTITPYASLGAVGSLQDGDEVLVFQTVSGNKTGRRGTLTQLRGLVVKAGTNISIAGDGTINSQAPAWWTNAGVPGSGVGVNFDYSIDPSNGNLYQKYSGTWTLIGNLRGPTGPSGPANNASPTQIGSTGNYATITAGGTTGAAIAFTQAGTGGFSFAGNTSVTGALSSTTFSASTSSSLAAATATSITMGAATATGLGTGIGHIIGPLINWNSTGIAGLKTSGRLIFGRLTPASNDYADFQFIRATTFTGGTLANINANMRVQTVMGAGDATNTWNMVSELTTSSTTGLGVGHYTYAKRAAGTAGSTIIGLVANGWDDSGNDSQTAGNAVAAEIDVQVVKLDNRTNLRTWGGTGSRKGIHITTVRANDANTDTLGVSNGIWFSNAMLAGGLDSNAFFGSLIGVATNTAAYSGFDFRGAIAPPGSSNPLIAVNMEGGAVIDFKGGSLLSSAPQRYLQYTASGTARLRYMAGATEALSIDDSALVTLGGSLKMGATTATGFGTAIGNIPVFINYNASGYPGLLLSSRFILARQTPAASDFADLQINRTTTFTGGTLSNINSGLRLIGNYGANDATSNWLLTSTATTNGTAGGNTVSAFFQAVRSASGRDHVWASIHDVIDQTGLSSSGVGQPTLSMEVDHEGAGADDLTNGAKYGGVGGRHFVHFLANRLSGATPYQLTHGLWFDSTGLAGVAGSSEILSVIGFRNNTAIIQALDTRGVQAASGYADPVAALRMAAGQIIDFNGGAALNSAAGSYLQYTTSGTARLRYMSGATELFSVDGSGNQTIYGSVVANSSAAAPITLANGVISVPSGQNMTLRLNSAGATLSAGASTAGLGNAITLTANSNGNSLFGALPNDLAINNRLTFNAARTPGNTYALSGSVTPTAFSGNGTTVTVTFAAISGVVIPVGSSVTITGATPSGYNGTWTVTASTTTTVSFASSTTGALTVAGTMTYAMATPEILFLQSNWTGTPSGAKMFAPYKFTIPTDTTDTRSTNLSAAAIYVAHNYGGAARGGKLGLHVNVTQTSAINDPSDGVTPNQQHTAIEAHMASQYNAGGTGTNINAAGSMYPLNPQARLQAGATYWRLLNGLGEVNLSLAASKRTITLGGTVTVGDTLSVSFTSTGIAGSPVTISWTVGAGQTLAMIANNLEARINQHAGLRAAQICAIARLGVLTVYWFTHLAALTITTSTSVGATETMTLGSVVSGASADIKAGMTIIRLSEDTGPATLNSAGIMFGGQSGSTSIGAFNYGILFGSMSGYDSIWPFGPNSSLISAGTTLNLGGAGKSGVIIPTEALYGVDFQTVSFGSTGAAWRSPGHVIRHDGSIILGGYKISASSAGLIIDAAGGATASVVALASGGGGGSGSTINNYFEGDIGFVLGGVLKVDSVDASTGAVTAFTTLVPPSYQGSAPSNPVAVTGGSGANWTVNITWPGSTSLSLQPSGGSTSVAGPLYLSSLPTSPTGLTAGRVWNNGGVLCVA